MKQCSNCFFALRVEGEAVYCGHPDNQIIMLGGSRKPAHVRAVNPHNACKYHEKEWLRGRFMSILAIMSYFILSLGLRYIHPGLGGWSWVLGLVLLLLVVVLTGVTNGILYFRKLRKKL